MLGRLRDPVFAVVVLGCTLSGILFWRDRASETDRLRASYEASARDRVAASQRVLASDIEWMGAAARMTALRPGAIDPRFLCDFANPTNDIGFIGSVEGPDTIRISDCQAKHSESIKAGLTPIVKQSASAMFRGAVRHKNALYTLFTIPAAGGMLVFGLDGERLIERALSYLPSAGVHVGIMAEPNGQHTMLAFHRSRLSKNYQLPKGYSRLKNVVTGEIGLADARFSVFCLPAANVLVPDPLTGVADLAGSLVITALLAVLIRRMRDQARETNRLIEVRTRQLAEARDEALESSRLKSRFLATMSHEIRTPMNGVIGMAQMLGETRLTPDQRGMVSDLVISARSLLSLLNNILDLSKIDAGKMAVASAPMDLVDVLRSAARTFSASAHAKAIGLEQSFQSMDAAGNSRPLERLSIAGDAVKLGQIVMNLVSNAVKFTETGAVELKVEARPVAGGKIAVRIEVADSGPGVPAELWPRLFQPFSQADGSDARRHGGSGLGLAITRNLVRLMGGELRGENRPEGGARFWLALTFEEASLPVQAETPERAPAARPVLAHVLLVEDNLINQKVALGALNRLGYRSAAAASGAEAITLLHGQDFDAVLMDCQMPEMDGFEATAIIRRMTGPVSRIPIIALTANGLPEDRERCLNAGMDDFIPKPLEFRRLGEVLERWIPQKDAPVASQSSVLT